MRDEPGPGAGFSTKVILYILCTAILRNKNLLYIIHLDCVEAAVVPDETASGMAL